MKSFSGLGNLYEILEISSNSDLEEVKSAYRRLALKWHPDKNLDNKEEAERRFKEISQAYEILSDPTERSRYDLYLTKGFSGIMPEPRPPRPPRPPMPPRTHKTIEEFFKEKVREFVDKGVEKKLAYCKAYIFSLLYGKVNRRAGNISELHSRILGSFPGVAVSLLKYIIPDQDSFATQNIYLKNKLYFNSVLFDLLDLDKEFLSHVKVDPSKCLSEEVNENSRDRLRSFVVSELNAQESFLLDDSHIPLFVEDKLEKIEKKISEISERVKSEVKLTPENESLDRENLEEAVADIVNLNRLSLLIINKMSESILLYVQSVLFDGLERYMENVFYLNSGFIFFDSVSAKYSPQRFNLIEIVTRHFIKVWRRFVYTIIMFDAFLVGNYERIINNTNLSGVKNGIVNYSDEFKKLRGMFFVGKTVIKGPFGERVRSLNLLARKFSQDEDPSQYRGGRVYRMIDRQENYEEAIYFLYKLSYISVFDGGHCSIITIERYLNNLITYWSRLSEEEKTRDIPDILRLKYAIHNLDKVAVQVFLRLKERSSKYPHTREEVMNHIFKNIINPFEERSHAGQSFQYKEEIHKQRFEEWIVKLNGLKVKDYIKELFDDFVILKNRERERELW